MTVALDGNNPGGMDDGHWARCQHGYAGSNGRYARFDTLPDGVEAMRDLLASYLARGFNTPAKIASRWAPTGDGGNNSATYAAAIAKGLGIKTSGLVHDAMQLTLAMAKIENAAFPARWAAEQKEVDAHV